MNDLDADHRLLATRFQEEQNLQKEAAERMSYKTLALDEDLAAAALEWARTGVMPDAPLIHGETPRGLNKSFFPTQVFIILSYLRTDGPEASRRLKFMPGRGTPPGVMT